MFMCLLCLKGSELKRRESRGGDDQQGICLRIDHSVCSLHVLPGAHAACRHSQTVAEFRSQHLRVLEGPSSPKLRQEEGRSECSL